MRKLSLILIIVLNSGVLFSQLNPEWVRSYNGSVNGNDEALTHISDNTGNIYASGKILGTGAGFDFYTVKFSPSGNILWESIYNGPGNGNDIAYSITLDNTGNVYVAGESKGENSDKDFVLIKYNSQGNEQWIRRYNGEMNSIDVAVKAVTDNSGSVIVTGHSWVTGSLFDIITIKYSSEGNVQWTKQYNGTGNGNELTDDLVIDASGNSYVCGSSFGTGTINDFVIIKYSSSGDEMWVRRYNGTANANDNMTSLTLDAAENPVITGTSIGAGTSLDFATIKYSPGGDELWVRRYTSQSVDIEEPKAIAGDIYGNIYITGTTTGFSSSYDYMTIKYSSSGDLMWAKRYNGPGSINFDEPRGIVTDAAGNVFVTGLSAGTGTMDDIVTIKYDPSGNEILVSRYNSPENRNDVPYNVSLDGFGNIILSGFITGAVTAMDFSVIKFSLLTNIMSVTTGIPAAFSLSQNYPNPFNPSTKIRFDVTRDARRERQDVRLNVYDVLGKEVAVLVNKKLSAGIYVVEFNAADYPGGVYFYRFETDEFSVSKSMLLLK